ncbi:MAG: VOC family protein [Solirubrobacteraceae bacterium]
MAREAPTLATGKICYLEIPATDVDRSSRFYADAFGWELRTRGDGAIAFDDAVKEVSGTWVTGRSPSAQPGIMVHVMVADLDASLATIRAAGGEVLSEDAAPGERVGHVADPAGNVIGVYQQPGLAARERSVAPVPEHLHTVTPRLALSDGAAGIEFYRAAFGATELGERYHMPDGTLVHAEILIGDSVVMIKDAQDDDFKALLCTYWPDVDAAWERAVSAGAEVVHPLADQFYGERGGRLADPFGNQWMFAQRIEILTPAQLATRQPA